MNNETVYPVSSSESLSAALVLFFSFFFPFLDSVLLKFWTTPPFSFSWQFSCIVQHTHTNKRDCDWVKREWNCRWVLWMLPPNSPCLSWAQNVPLCFCPWSSLIAQPKASHPDPVYVLIKTQKNTEKSYKITEITEIRYTDIQYMAVFDILIIIWSWSELIWSSFTTYGMRI